MATGLTRREPLWRRRWSLFDGSAAPLFSIAGFPAAVPAHGMCRYQAEGTRPPWRDVLLAHHPVQLINRIILWPLSFFESLPRPTTASGSPTALGPEVTLFPSTRSCARHGCSRLRRPGPDSRANATSVLKTSGAQHGRDRLSVEVTWDIRACCGCPPCSWFVVDWLCLVPMTCGRWSSR